MRTNCGTINMPASRPYEAIKASWFTYAERYWTNQSSGSRPITVVALRISFVDLNLHSSHGQRDVLTRNQSRQKKISYSTYRYRTIPTCTVPVPSYVLYGTIVRPIRTYRYERKYRLYGCTCTELILVNCCGSTTCTVATFHQNTRSGHDRAKRLCGP